MTGIVFATNACWAQASLCFMYACIDVLHYMQINSEDLQAMPHSFSQQSVMLNSRDVCDQSVHLPS